jgi:hypothetical protein
MSKRTSLRNRLRTLETHLRKEQPGLVPLLPLFRKVDRTLYRMGLLHRADSLATRIPWWPMISVLGTFSAGKSSFINSYLGIPLQDTGNQAVDDKFTVICHGKSEQPRVLPGTALNADPRFPFFRMSDEIEKVAPGEGKRIDAYLQLKTVSSPRSWGVILIDSPGFDSDDQRRSTLRITDHIIDLSDLVLIFFDARHPEPGAMQDTLQHLVSKTVRRADPTKFLYILNQIDTTAKEDNAADVVGAWQRAIAQAGLVSGRFYAIYNSDVAPVIEDPGLRARYEAKRDHDLREIHGRVAEIGVGRSYRVVAMLETVINELDGEVIPELQSHLSRWRKRVMIWDMAWGAVVLAAFVAGIVFLVDGGPGGALAWLVGGPADPVLESVGEANPVSAWLGAATAWLGASLSGVGQDAGAVAARGLAVALGLWAVFQTGHQWARASVAARIAPSVPETSGNMNLRVRDAFRRNTGFWTRVYRGRPVGCGGGVIRRLDDIRETGMEMVQRLNDEYTNPAGQRRITPAQVLTGSPSDGSGLGVPPGTSAFAAEADPAPPSSRDPDTDGTGHGGRRRSFLGR